MKAWVYVAAATVTLAGCASDTQLRTAAENRQPVRALLSEDALLFVGFDANGDMRTTMDEVEAGITREFARADTDHDGRITPIEFQAWADTVLGGSDLGPFRIDFDRNVDNVITREEFHDEIMARARSYDANNDGAITRGEYVRVLNQVRPVQQQIIRRAAPGG